MPPKKQKGGRKTVRKSTGRRKAAGMYGGSWLGDAWNWTKGAVGTTGNFLKDSKLISKGLSLIPHPYAQAGAPIAGMLGLGHPQYVMMPQKKWQALVAVMFLVRM